VIDALKAQRRPAMKKISTVTIEKIQIFKGKQLTIGVDLEDRTSHYCVLNEAGKVIVASNLPTKPKRIQQDSTQPDRAGNRDAFRSGQPAVDSVRP
jgi:hypothetical protein